MKKVSWPARQEVIGTTIVVVVAVFFFGLYLGLVDYVLVHGTGQWVLRLFHRAGGLSAVSKLWYIIHTYSGFERKVAESLRSRVKAFNLESEIHNVLIPTEEVVEVRGGKRVISQKMFYPGYVLVEMETTEKGGPSDRSLAPRQEHAASHGFVGSGQTPTPLSDEEVQQIVFGSLRRRTNPKPKLTFEKGETVKNQ